MTIYSLAVELTPTRSYRLIHLATNDRKTEVLNTWEASTLDELRDVPKSWGEASATHIRFMEKNIPLENAHIPAVPPEPVSDSLLFDIAARWAEPSKHMHKKTDTDAAVDAAMNGISSIGSNMLIVGRYWWNIQMKIIQATGVMPVFKSHVWLFWVVGFLLLIFLFPLGIAFAFSAWCAGQMELDVENDFIVPLKHDQQP